MPDIALIAHFPGNADDLAEPFRTAAHRYANMPGAAVPTASLLLRNKDGIAVVLVWPEGASLQPFRTFLRDALQAAYSLGWCGIGVPGGCRECRPRL
jgi:hypothetical protein